jgi:hypothetical protein
VKKLTLTLLTSLFFLSPNVVLGSEDLFLVCVYHSSIDDKGVNSQTSGSDTLQISYLEGTDEKNVTIKKSGLGALFTGTQSKTEIRAETFYLIQGKPYRQRLVINRYSGTFQLSFEVGPKFSGLIHYGECEKMKDKLF